MDNDTLMRPPHRAYARQSVEARVGSIREALLERLRAGLTREQIAREWDVHENTIRAWIAEERIQRQVTYTVKGEPAGARM